MAQEASTRIECVIQKGIVRRSTQVPKRHQRRWRTKGIKAHRKYQSSASAGLLPLLSLHARQLRQAQQSRPTRAATRSTAKQGIDKIECPHTNSQSSASAGLLLQERGGKLLILNKKTVDIIRQPNPELRRLAIPEREEAAALILTNKSHRVDSQHVEPLTARIVRKTIRTSPAYEAELLRPIATTTRPEI